MKFILAFLAAFFLLIGCKSEYHPLFNHKNLDGWEVYGEEKWMVYDSVLIAESGPDARDGYLITKKDYNNFILKLDFKHESNSTSGVFFKSNVSGTDNIHGWKIQIAPPNHYTGGVYEANGRGWLATPDLQKDHFLKFGKWNTLEIQVDQGKVTSWLNGNKMTDIVDHELTRTTGKIALQIHHGEGFKMKWKNIEIKEY